MLLKNLPKAKGRPTCLEQNEHFKNKEAPCITSRS
jgi:hypothetical protein